MVRGRAACVPVLAAQYLAAMGLLVAGVLLPYWPWPAAAGLVTAPLAWRAWCVTRAAPDDLARLPLAMAANVLVAVLTPALMAAGIALG